MTEKGRATGNSGRPNRVYTSGKRGIAFRQIFVIQPLVSSILPHWMPVRVS